ncbi:MAG: sulfurtransferase TusA family protein [Pseudomonadota bacterium]
MKTDLEIDALGLLCPLPVLRLRKRMAALAADSTVCLLADDPAAAIDVPHFCQESGHTFLGAEARGAAGADATAYYVRKR